MMYHMYDTGNINIARYQKTGLLLIASVDERTVII